LLVKRAGIERSTWIFVERRRVRGYATVGMLAVAAGGAA